MSSTTSTASIDQRPRAHRPGHELSSLRDLAKFVGGAAVLAMFVDAAVGHALLWENDPFWTYWATDTFLIAAVFAIGTAVLGIGTRQGAIVAAVQAVVLTLYYWTLSPIHVPSSPEWLDLQHTWVTGVPVHFGVYYLGYLTALWLWRRPSHRVDDAAAPEALRVDVARALAVGATVVVSTGIVQAVALGEAPGVTWFVQRIVIASVFTIVWWAAAGRDRSAAVAGAITLAFVLLTYSHFLGPVGLPDTDLRLLAPDAPPATSHWLSWTEEWIMAFPITLLASLVALLVASSRREGGWRPVELERRHLVGATVAILLIGAIAGVAAVEGGPDDHRVDVSSRGAPVVDDGVPVVGEPGDGELRLVAQDRNPRVTPLPPHDRVHVVASVVAAGGESYEIEARQPMVSEPRGRFTTFGGVGFDKWNHGRSGIGSADRPEVRSEVSVFALGEVRRNGELLASNVSVHAFTLDHGVELHVGDPEAPIAGLPTGVLTAAWPARVGTSPEGHQRAHNGLGAAVLAALLLMAIAANRTEAHAHGFSATSDRPTPR